MIHKPRFTEYRIFGDNPICQFCRRAQWNIRVKFISPAIPERFTQSCGLVGLLFFFGNDVLDSGCDRYCVLDGCIDVFFFGIGCYKACFNV